MSQWVYSEQTQSSPLGLAFLTIDQSFWRILWFSGFSPLCGPGGCVYLRCCCNAYLYPPCSAALAPGLCPRTFALLFPQAGTCSAQESEAVGNW